MLPYQTLINIEPNNKRAIYEQIAINFINLINKGTIPAGTKLPSSRALANLLKLHRKTIVAAYSELIIQGWIVSKTKSGYFVNPEISVSDIASNPQYPCKSPIALKIQYSELPNEIEDSNDIFIDDGLPDARLAPYRTLLRAYKSVADREYNLKRTNYGTYFTSTPLKDALSKHLTYSRGIDHSASNIFITNGAQMGIYLVGKALISKGDIFLVGTPGYSIAKQSFESNGATTMEVSVDDYGIDVDKIKELCEIHKIKGIYVIPHHHYPTTVTLSPERRNQLLSLAFEYDFVIIEDDYDYDFHYSSAPHLPMASYNHSGRVIYIGSLSKCFSPSLRLGFVLGPDDLIDTLVNVRKIIDVRGDSFMEHALAILFENGEIERHLRKSNKLYKERRDHICGRIDLHLKGFASFRVPSGGMAVWIKFFRKYDVLKICSLLKKYGISFNQNIIFNRDKGMNHIRLGFASLNFAEIDKCIISIRESCIKLEQNNRGISESQQLF